LFTIPAGGGTTRRLRTDTAPNPTEPDWSPDGKMIAFTTMRGGGNFDICVVDYNGEQAARRESWRRAKTLPGRPIANDHFHAGAGGAGAALSLLDVPTNV